MRRRIVPLVGLLAVVVLGAIAVGTQGDDEAGGEVVAEATGSPATSAPSAAAVSEDSGAAEAPAETGQTVATIPVLRPAPDLVELDGWLQSDVGSLEELRGRVVVLQFWTFGCSNCKATLPYLQDLAAAHAGEPFEIVGVHAPEFEYEQDPDAISEAAARLGVTWPIALDTDRRNFRAWQGSPAYWPRTYVIDGEGNIRFDHIGEGAYEELADTVAALLDET